jgi:cell division GTPase FtsZ
MKLGLIGVGQAGGKILDRFLQYDTRHDTHIVRGAVAVNTAKTDLQGLEYVPEDNRVLIGADQVKGHGVGADNKLGAEVMQNDIGQVTPHFDNFPAHKIDAFLVVAALGGGTGSGGAPVVARELKRLYEEPVYGLGIFPSPEEGSIYSLNAARSFQTFVDEVDNLLIFDNDAWRESGESMSGGYERLNDELVRRFGMLFTAGEFTGDDDIAESVVDSSEIINTLSGGGITTVGYASEEVSEANKGLLDRFTGSETEIDTGEATNRITSLVRKASLGRLTLPCNINSTERALVVIAGPQAHLSRKGIEQGRSWVEENAATREVRGGDYPVEEPNVASLVVFSGVTDADRVKELQQIAIEAQDTIEEVEASSAEELDELVNDEEDDLDPLF